jgi:arylsulfatase
MPDKPNVLLITADHWGGMLTRPGGHPVVMTPTVSQLARLGTWYQNTYSPAPSCIPARRSLMTGLSVRTHGDRTFNEREELPDVPTLAQTFRDAGYQATAVGKLHVYPQRDRIGFDEVILNEEGRHHLEGNADDWEMYLADEGYAGKEYAAGHSSGDYNVTPWHLPDEAHPTNWTTREMCRTIRRRDPRKPAFWYMSHIAPHPPMWPLQSYLDLYRDIEIDPPAMGEWTNDPDTVPWMLKAYNDGGGAMKGAPAHEIEEARRAFYALVTHIDHQLRVVIGALREEGILDNTIIALTADHGDMLGDHGRWAKTLMFDMSAKVPLVIVPPKGDARITPGQVDNRLVETMDIMPTLLDLAGVPVPDTVEGSSLLTDDSRDHIYGEHWEGDFANRMVRDSRYKLIYYPVGNSSQLFDMQEDRREEHDLSESADHATIRSRLTDLLIAHLYGVDLEWLQDGKLVGVPLKPLPQYQDRGLGAQRGIRYM